jgi:hypothetical protein
MYYSIKAKPILKNARESTLSTAEVHKLCMQMLACPSSDKPTRGLQECEAASMLGP